MSAQIEVQVVVGRLEIDVAFDCATTPMALVGANGSGKTTVLRAIAGALPEATGRIMVGSELLLDTQVGAWVPIERRRVGYVPQGYGLFEHLTVLDNVAFGLSTGHARLPKAQRRARAQAQLEALGCAELGHRYPARLSGGEQQRVALARALCPRPALLLLDEPLSALDAGARRSVRRVLADHLERAGCPTIIVTHDPRDVAALGAEIVAIEAGRVIQRGTLAEIRAAPASDFLAEFVGSDENVAVTP